MLDQLESLRVIDKEGMVDFLKAFSERVDAVFAHALPDLRLPVHGIRSIAVVGMGGSAIGGDLAAAAYADTVDMPIVVIRSAFLPAWVSTETLVIAVSYSGNTEEVMSAYAAARLRGCPMAVVAHGGALAARAVRDRVPFVEIGAYPQPRLAVGELTAAVMKIILRVCGKAHENDARRIVGALKELHPRVLPSVPTEENPAKFLAYKLLDRIPVIAGGGICAPVAKRWKTQINENAKTICVRESFPELLHNTIEGLRAPMRVADDSVWVLLEAPDDHAVPRAQLERLSALLARENICTERVTAPGDDPRAAQWWLLYLGDWVSYYLALLNGVDPMPVPTIQSCK